MFIYLWVTESQAKNIRSYLKLSKRTMTDWCDFFSGVCSRVLLSMSVDEMQIDGEGIIVEIDETLVSKKRKYNRGYHTKEIWMFAGIERGTKKWFGQVVLKRDRQTLVELIKK